MKYRGKIAMVSLLSLSACLLATAAKADERDGTIERYVCVREGTDNGALRSNFVQLKNKNAGFGFGGGNWALKLANDGVKTSGLGKETYAGGTATFTPQKKEDKIEIFFKPENVDIDHVSVDYCIRTPTQPNNWLQTGLTTMEVTPVANGWFRAFDDLDLYGPVFRGGIVNKIAIRLNTKGDNGNILIGDIRVYNNKEVIDPSKLIMDLQPCGVDPINQPCTGN